MISKLRTEGQRWGNFISFLPSISLIVPLRSYWAVISRVRRGGPALQHFYQIRDLIAAGNFDIHHSKFIIRH
jgi:hypothetical protein